MDFLGKRILEKYLPVAQDTFKKYLEDTKIRLCLASYLKELYMNKC